MNQFFPCQSVNREMEEDTESCLIILGDAMKKQDLQFFKDLLDMQLESLMNKSNLAVAELISQKDREIEYLDRASLHIDQTMSLRIKSRESLLIKKIRHSLERIEEGTYGICETCGEDIGIKRLNARPVTTKCITCKNIEEREERTFATTTRAF